MLRFAGHTFAEHHNGNHAAALRTPVQCGQEVTQNGSGGYFNSRFRLLADTPLSGRRSPSVGHALCSFRGVTSTSRIRPGALRVPSVSSRRLWPPFSITSRTALGMHSPSCLASRFGSRLAASRLKNSSKGKHI